MWRKLLQQPTPPDWLVAAATPPSAHVIDAALSSFEPLWLKLEEGAPVHGWGDLRLPSGETHAGFFRDDLRTGPGLWQSAVRGQLGALERGRSAPPSPRIQVRLTAAGDGAAGTADRHGHGDTLASVCRARFDIVDGLAADSPGRDGPPLGVLGSFRGGELSGLAMVILQGGAVHVGPFSEGLPTGFGRCWRTATRHRWRW